MTPLRRLDHAVAAASKRLWMPLNRLRIRAAGARCASSVEVIGMPLIGQAKGSSIELEDGVVLCSRSRWTALGIAHPVVLRTLCAGARLRIGRGTGISGGSICAAAAIDIGEGCLIGADVTICDTDFHARSAEDRRAGDDWSRIERLPITIGNDVFIGAGAFILKGVVIGDGAIVGAGAVVTHPVAAGDIVAGNPARPVGHN